MVCCRASAWTTHRRQHALLRDWYERTRRSSAPTQRAHQGNVRDKRAVYRDRRQIARQQQETALLAARYRGTTSSGLSQRHGGNAPLARNHRGSQQELAGARLVRSHFTKLIEIAPSSLRIPRLQAFLVRDRL